MKLPGQLRVRLLSWLSVGFLTLASLLSLVYVLPSRGLAQLAPAQMEAVGSGDAEFRQDEPPTEACSFDLSAQDLDPPTGTFTCAMSEPALELGIPFTEMTAEVTGFETSAVNEVLLSGTSTLQLPDGTEQDGVDFVLRVTAGGPDEGSLRIRLLGVFDGQPGDAKAGNGDYDQWRQILTDGSISIQDAPTPSPSETPSPSPSGSPSPSPSGTPSPTPSASSSPPPTPTPTPTPTISQTSPAPSSTIPPVHDAPIPAAGANSTARMMALLGEASGDGTPKLEDILSVVGPFPVAGLTWWTDDWHAYRCCPYPHLHQGLDMFASFGTPVVAAADGYVSQKVDDPALSGLGVEVTDATNTQYFYAHLSRFATGMAVGQRVRRGQVIGYVGNTGNAVGTSPHLHFEVQPNGVPVPPKPLVDRWLVAAEQEAEALVASRTGHAVLDPADLHRWLSLVGSLDPGADSGLGDVDSPGGDGVLTSISTVPKGPAAGGMIALASTLLLLLLVAPACLLERRDLRRAVRVTGGDASDPPNPSNPPSPPGPLAG